MSEILAPAGGIESLIAAVHAGADAVYLGLPRFSARRGAKNFTPEELENGVVYAKRAGVKVYLALNTLVYDKEWHDVMEAVRFGCALPVDGLIVQDLGLATLVREMAPDMPLHASTQTSVHTPFGVKLLQSMGFCRVVAPREFTKEQLAELCQTGISIEAFVHGALCFCVSGQCYLSSFLGRNSANRGRCAQPCRLPFSAKKGAVAARYDLSLKDLTLVKQKEELKALGVASFKIEGRMKRPEYVAAAVAAFGRKNPDLELLQNVFSRDGFTDGYYKNATGTAMFGRREKQDVLAASPKLLKQIRAEYQSPKPRVPLAFCVILGNAKPLQLTVRDLDGHEVTVTAEQTQTNVGFCATEELAKRQLSKLGGTPYYANDVTCRIKPGSTVSVALLNRLRREAIAQLDQLRTACSAVLPRPLPAWKSQQQEGTGFSYWISCRKASQLCLVDSFSAVILPLDEIERHWEGIAPFKQKVFAEPPRFYPGQETEVQQKLTKLKARGIKHLFAQNVGHIALGKKLGFTLHGGPFLNTVNSRSLRALQSFGFADCTLSFELSRRDIYALDASLPRGVVLYGHWPAMIGRICPVKNEKNCQDCRKNGELIDRKGQRWPVRCQKNFCEIYNPTPLYLGDCLDQKDLRFGILQFTYETPEACEKIATECLHRVYKNKNITKGWYQNGEA